MKTRVFVAALLTAVAAAQDPGLGGSILLPEFDPAAQTQKILDSLSRLSSVQDAIAESKERMGPLVEAYQKEPSIDNREALERELAGLTLQLSRNVERVAGEKERVRYALQDLNRLSLTSERAVSSAVDSLRQKAGDEDLALRERREELEVLARAVELADRDEKAAALSAFKLAHRTYRRIELRQQVLQATARNHENLLRGIRAVRRGFDGVSGNLDDVFARIEDAGALLGFVAGIRRESAELLGQYQRLFGSGSDSLREALTTLSSIEGQLQLVNSLTESLDAAGSFTTIVAQMEDFSRGLMPEGEVAGPAGTAEDYWLDEVRRVTNGRFFSNPRGAAAGDSAAAPAAARPSDSGDQAPPPVRQPTGQPVGKPTGNQAPSMNEEQ